MFYRIIFILACYSHLSVIDCQKQFIIDTSLEDIKIIEQVVTFNSANPQTFVVKDTGILWSLSTKIHTPVSIHNAIGAFFYSLDDKPNSGRVYAAINPIGIRTDGANQRVGLGLELADTLVKDELYKVGFYIKPFSGNCFAPGIEVAFSRNSINYYYSRDIINYDDTEQYLKLHRKGAETIVKDTSLSISDLPLDSYTKISFLYKAVGGERSIYIGSIKADTPKKIRKIKRYGYYKNLKSKYYSCYLVDDVVITGLNPDSESQVKQSPHVRDTLSYFFEKDSFTTVIDYDLLKLQVHLHPPEQYKVRVIGSADMSGKSQYNMQLSAKRSSFIGSVIKTISGYEITEVGEGTLNIPVGEAPARSRRADVIFIRK